MFFAPNSLKTSEVASDNAAANRAAFDWLLVLGFPIEVAAAKAMPELFAER